MKEAPSDRPHSCRTSSILSENKREPMDFTYRVITKGVMRVYDTVMINMFKRYFAPRRQQLAISLQMGDERVVAHMD